MRVRESEIERESERERGIERERGRGRERAACLQFAITFVNRSGIVIVLEHANGNRYKYMAFRNGNLGYTELVQINFHILRQRFLASVHSVNWRAYNCKWQTPL